MTMHLFTKIQLHEQICRTVQKLLENISDSWHYQISTFILEENCFAGKYFRTNGEIIKVVNTLLKFPTTNIKISIDLPGKRCTKCIDALGNS